MVWRFAGSRRRIFSTWGLKPMSSIRSASSRTSDLDLRLEGDHAPVGEILQPSGSGDEDVRALQPLGLRADRRAAVGGLDADALRAADQRELAATPAWPARVSGRARARGARRCPPGCAPRSEARTRASSPSRSAPWPGRRVLRGRPEGRGSGWETARECRGLRAPAPQPRSRRARETNGTNCSTPSDTSIRDAATQTAEGGTRSHLTGRPHAVRSQHGSSRAGQAGGRGTIGHLFAPCGRLDHGVSGGHVFRLFRQTLRDVSLPNRLLLASGVGFVAVFALVLAYGRPGLGLGQLFYVPVVLAALATGPWLGALAGVPANFLFQAGMLLNGAATWSSGRGGEHPDPAGQLHPRRSDRRLLRHAGAAARRLAPRARRPARPVAPRGRDRLAHERGAEQAVNKRIGAGKPFGLLVGETVGRRKRDDELRRTARLLSTHLHADDQLARLGPSRFAVLVSARTPGRDARRASCLSARSSPRTSRSRSAGPSIPRKAARRSRSSAQPSTGSRPAAHSRRVGADSCQRGARRRVPGRPRRERVVRANVSRRRRRSLAPPRRRDHL